MRRVRVRRRPEVRRALACLLLLWSGGTFAAEGPTKVSLNALAAGALSRTNLAFGMLEGRFALSKNLRITAGPALLEPEGGDVEYQFRAAATLLAQLGRIQLDDRNLWVFSDAGTTRYRNRLRFTLPLEMGSSVVRVQLYDEAFYQEGGRGWFRNTIAAGVGVDTARPFSADAYWMLQDDDRRPQASMFLVLFTLHLF